MLEGILLGLQTAFSVQMLIMVIGGCLIGTFIGMLPGLGPMSIIAIMIPVAISMGDPAAAIILLAGVYYGAIFGGSTSSILLNAMSVNKFLICFLEMFRCFFPSVVRALLKSRLPRVIVSAALSFFR